MAMSSTKITLLLFAVNFSFFIINFILGFIIFEIKNSVLDRLQGKPHVDSGPKYTTLRLHTQRSTPDCVPRAPIPTLIISRISRRRFWSKRAYIRVNLFHPEGTHHFLQHFLNTLFQFHYWLECWSANVPAGTIHSTAKTHRCRVGSHCHHNREFSATVATQSFSSGSSFDARRRWSFANRHGPTILHCNRFQLRTSPL